jgi:uracil-DNA glycosylase
LAIKRHNGDLTDWAKQGVLLLNASLTVTAFKPNSHEGLGWQTFTDNVIKYINEHLSHVVFVLWGNFAKSKQVLITNPDHYVLTASHPSPLSAHFGFFGSKPFSQINRYLLSHHLQPINW